MQCPSGVINTHETSACRFPCAASACRFPCSVSARRFCSFSLALSLSASVLRLASTPARINFSTLFENAAEFFLNRSCHDWSECLSAMGYCAAEEACE